MRNKIARFALRVGQLGCRDDDPEELRTRKVTITVAALTIAILAVGWVGTYLALGMPVAAAIPASYQVATLIGLVAFSRSKDLGPIRITQLALMTFLPFLLQWVVGGYVNSSAVSLWSLVAALGAVFFLGGAGAVPWFGAFLLLTIVSAVLEPIVAADARVIPFEVRTAFFALNVVGVSVTAYAILQYYVRQREAELGRADRLLLNILPSAIAQRLKREGRVSAQAYADVSVLFADVVDFTPYVERTPAGEVVDLLDRVFSTFDDLADRHGLEKIKTIGDAYMVAGGLPDARPDHVGAVALMALDMAAAAARFTADGTPVRLRIGIDCGPVVAGVIGRRKFIYDLWGDAVNTASRMESHGVPGRIQVTPAVEARLRDRYTFEAREPIEVKGKGTMVPSLLVGPRG
jgi:class 3 adenylate cyclase